MSQDNFEYTIVDGNIHKFVMYAIDRRTIDRYLEVFRESLETLGNDEPYLTILDYSHSGMPPINYSFQRIERIHKERGVKPESRSLIIHNDSTMSRLAETILKPWGFLSMKFARAGEEDQYMNWLKTGTM